MNYWNWLNVFYTGVSNHTGGSMCNGLILRETPAETIAIDYSGIAWGVQARLQFSRQNLPIAEFRTETKLNLKFL
jgi:hypothetical protein